MNNYTCRECGIHFKPETGSKSCPACGSESISLYKKDPVPLNKATPVLATRPYESPETALEKPERRSKPHIVSGTVDYSCNDCGEHFKSHEREMFCPACKSGYILKQEELGEKESKIIADLKGKKKDKHENSFLYIIITLFLAGPLLILSFAEGKVPLTIILIILVLLVLAIPFIQEANCVLDEHRNKSIELEPVFFIFLIFFNLLKSLFFLIIDQIRNLIRKISFTVHKIDLLIIREHAVIWSSPLKRRAKISGIVNQGFRIEATDIITRGTDLYHVVRYKNKKCYILSNDSINLKGLLNSRLGYKLFIVGEKPVVHLYESPSTESKTVQTLDRGFYIHNIGTVPVYNPDSDSTWYDFRYNSSVYWSAYHNETWIEVYKGFGLIGYARRDDFYSYITWA